jgi:ADP-ribose pyrophosphatase YjhB (NUDIX family)
MESPEINPRFSRRVPEGDNRERMVCDECGFIHYENPRIVVAAVAMWTGRILLCRRAIEPRRGFWTLPGGFLEIGETTEEGAIRETREETGAAISIRDLLAVYSLPHIGQVHLVYRAIMESDEIEPGEESLEARLVDPSEIPWDELAFPTNTWALRDFLDLVDEDSVVPRSRPEAGV